MCFSRSCVWIVVAARTRHVVWMALPRCAVLPIVRCTLLPAAAQTHLCWQVRALKQAYYCSGGCLGLRWDGACRCLPLGALGLCAC